MRIPSADTSKQLGLGSHSQQLPLPVHETDQAAPLESPPRFKLLSNTIKNVGHNRLQQMEGNSCYWSQIKCINKANTMEILPQVSLNLEIFHTC